MIKRLSYRYIITAKPTIKELCRRKPTRGYNHAHAHNDLYDVLIV